MAASSTGSYTFSSGGQTYLASPTASTTAAQKAAVASNPFYTPYTGGTAAPSPAGTAPAGWSPTAWAQQQADMAKYFPNLTGAPANPAPPVPKSMPGADMGTVSPLNLPQPTPPSSSTAFIGSLPTTATPPPDTTGQPTARDSFLSKYQNLIDRLGTQGQRYQDLQSKYQIPQITQQLADVRGTIAQRNAQYLQQWQMAGNERAALPYVTGEQTQIQRTQAIEIGVLTAQEQALAGNLKAAQDIVDKTIEHEFEPIKTQLSAMAQFYQMNQNDLSESEKLRVENQYALMKFNAEQLYNGKKDAYNYAINSNASPQVVSELAAAKTPEELASIQAKYGIAPAKYSAVVNPITGEQSSFNTFTGRYGGSVGGGASGTTGDTSLPAQLQSSVREAGGIKYLDMSTISEKQLPLAQRASVQSGFPLVSKSDADKVKAAQASFDSASGLIKDVTSLSSKLITATTPASAVGQAAALNIQAKIPGTDARTYVQSVNAFVSLITRAAGEKGVLTDADVTRIKNALPALSDTKEQAQNKVNNLNNVIQSTLNGAVSAYLGKTSQSSTVDLSSLNFKL